MKKQNKTFAQRARDIESKYKRAAFDKIEKEGMESELEALMAEQEQVREMMGLNQQEQPMQEFGNGGKMMMDGFETTQEIPETQSRNNTGYPSWLPTWATSSLDFLGDVDRLGMDNARDLITGIAPVPGRGFKGGLRGLGNRQMNPATTFTNIGERTVTPTGDALRAMSGKPNYNTSTKSQIDKLLTTNFGGKTPTTKIGNLSGKVEGAVPSSAESMYGNLQNIGGKWYTVDPATGVNMPWKGIGYGAAGVGGIGAIGAGIYGLTQLPDGRVVDAQGNPVDGMTGAATSVSQQAGFQPTEERLNSIGWNSKLPTEEAVRTGVRTGGTGRGGRNNNTPITQPLIQDNIGRERLNTQYNGDMGTGITPISATQGMNSLNTPNKLDLEMNKLQSRMGNSSAGNKESFWDKNKQYAPYAISGASNIASNLLMAAMTKKNQQRINPVLATPERMNMEPQAEQMRKDASVSKNIGMKQARDLGLNAGATLANMGAIGSGVDRNLANTLTNLYGQQEQYNTGVANQFTLQNQDASNRAGMMNAQLGNQANQDRLGFVGGALGTIPGVMKDVRMDKADAQMRDVMDRYYQSIGGRNYATVGSIFKDPASGFKYKVKPDLTLEKVK